MAGFDPSIEVQVRVHRASAASRRPGTAASRTAVVRGMSRTLLNLSRPARSVPQRRRPAGAGDTVYPARAARDGLPAVEPLREGQTAFAAGAGQSAQTVPCHSEHRPAVRRRHPEGIQARGVGPAMEGVLSRSGFTPDVRNARYTLENKRIVGTPTRYAWWLRNPRARPNTF